MGLQVADDNSVVTILLPKEVAFPAGLKDVKEKLNKLV